MEQEKYEIYLKIAREKCLNRYYEKKQNGTLYIDCPCGKRYDMYHKKQHLNSKTHQTWSDKGK